MYLYMFNPLLSFDFKGDAEKKQLFCAEAMAVSCPYHTI